MLPFGGTGLMGSQNVNWNSRDKDPQLFLTFNNAHVTKTTGIGYPSGIRSIISRSTGKFHVEHSLVHVGFSAGVDMSIGLSTGSAAIVGSTNHVGQTAGTVGLYSGEGNIYLNGSMVVAANIPFTSGNVLIMEWDATARLAWWSVYNGSTYSNWNGSVSANPATGAGGVDISSISGPLFAAAVAQAVTSEFQTNFGLTAFMRTPSTGFGAFT